MVPPTWMIEELERMRREREEQERPSLHIELPLHRMPERAPEREERSSGVVVIEL